jgi:hypothetical protein
MKKSQEEMTQRRADGLLMIQKGKTTSLRCNPRVIEDWRRTTTSIFPPELSQCASHRRHLSARKSEPETLQK